MRISSVHIPKFNLKKIRQNVSENEQVARTKAFIERRPFTAFLASLGILLALIILGSVVSTLTRTTEAPKAVIKNVNVHTIGGTANIAFQGQVESTGVLTIVAQAPGVVNSIAVKEGQEVGQGQTLVSLASNYQGGNVPGLQSALAQAQLKNVNETYDAQKELINKQREVADQTNANTVELRNIQNNSIDDLQAVVGTNDTILTSLYATLRNLQATNVNGANDALILQTQQGIAQVQGGLTQLNAQLQSTQYQVTPTNPPSRLADLQRDITKKQLDVQEKGLELARKSAKIQAAIAAVSAATMQPASPVKGTVEKIHVQVGESVQPGDIIATIGGASDNIIINTLVPRNVAVLISRTQESTITLGNTTARVAPYYVSTVPTDGQLYSALYSIPGNYADRVTEDGFVTVDIPLNAEVKQTDPYVPIDSVYQTQENAYVYVVQNGKAATKEVTLGRVFGQYAQIISGLTNGDEIIVNRNIVAGERVNIVKN